MIQKYEGMIPALALAMEAARETVASYRAEAPDGCDPQNIIDGNSLAGFLTVYAQESLEQYIAQMPKVDLFTKNFSSEVMNGGVAITTRISNTTWGTANDLSQGWSPTTASSTAVTATLGLKDFDMIFNELEWSTITPQVLINTFFKPMAGQMANAIVVDCISKITTASYTNSLTIPSSSNFSVTGSYSLQTCSTILDTLEIPREGRYAIVSPALYQGLVSGILPTYIYGTPDAVQRNKAQELLNFEVDRYARFYGASVPQGGNYIVGGANGKLVGITGNRDGLVVAMRTPVDPNNGLVQSATAIDPSSGVSLQTRMIFDASKPGWRLAVVGLWGSAAGNTDAIVPIITQSV
jgi:hypothetical protein